MQAALDGQFRGFERGIIKVPSSLGMGDLAEFNRRIGLGSTWEGYEEGDGVIKD